MRTFETAISNQACIIIVLFDMPKKDATVRMQIFTGKLNTGPGTNFFSKYACIVCVVPRNSLYSGESCERQIFDRTKTIGFFLSFLPFFFETKRMTMTCIETAPKYEQVRLVFKGLVGLLVDPTQIDPENLRVFVSIAQGDDDSCQTSPCSYPIRLSQALSSDPSSRIRRYVAIWHEHNKGVVIQVKPNQALCLQICVQFASGSSLALGCCKWRPARKGDSDLIVKHYKQEGAAIHIDPKGDAMLRFYSAEEASSSSPVRRGQLPALPPSPNDTPKSMKKHRIKKLNYDEEDDTSLSSFVSISSIITVRHRNSATGVDTNHCRTDNDPSWDHREWKSFDTPDCFRDVKKSWSWLKMTQSTRVRGIDCDMDDKMRLPPRPPRRSDRKAPTATLYIRPSVDVLGETDSNNFLFSNDECKEDEQAQRTVWKNGAFQSQTLIAS